MVFRREGTYAIVGVLVVFVVAAVLFAVPAWSQNKSGDPKDRKEPEQQKRTQKSETRTQKSEPPTPKTATRAAESLAARLAPRDPTAREALEEAAQAEASEDLDDDNRVITDGDPIDFIEIRNAGDCNIDLGDSITFAVSEPGVSGITFATVINGSNVIIDPEGNRITVADNLNDPPGNIQFFTTAGLTTLPANAILEVETSSINCGDNSNGNNTNNLPPRFFPPFFDDPNDFFDEDEDFFDEDEDGDVDSSINSTADEDCIETFDSDDNDANNIDDTDPDTPSATPSEESASLERIDVELVAFQTDNDLEEEFSEEEFSEEEFSEEDIEDEDTETDTLEECEDEDGVSATSDEDGATAETPGATARAGGDPDDQEPVTEVPDDVVDEVPTSGPLPNTGGFSPIVLALSTALSVGGLLAFWAVVTRRARA